MSGMTGASMLRTRRKDVNVKPNRKLDRKSSRGMLYENEELRLRTININAEVERGQSDIKKLKRENEQLKREILALRYEYDRLDKMLRERKSSPEHSDDSASVCSQCPECISLENTPTPRGFNDLSVVPEEGEQEGNKSGIESPCTCEECQNEDKKISIFNQQQINNDPLLQNQKLTTTTFTPNLSRSNKSNGQAKPKPDDIGLERIVDVLVHDAPLEPPRFFESVTSQPYDVSPPPPGFVINPYQAPRFHQGGNVEDLLGDVQANPATIQTTYIQQNSVFMTSKVTHVPCCCQKQRARHQEQEEPKSYVTEKNIELTYDYPKSIPIPSNSSQSNTSTATTEIANTVVFIEKRIPVKPKRFDFFFRSRSAPVGDHEEPIYATVNKLPKRLRRMELANLEKEVAYKAGEPDSSTRTEMTIRSDSESAAPAHEDDTSRSEREKSAAPQRPDTPKQKKRKRFSLTFKKRERKKRDKDKKKIVSKNGNAKNGNTVPILPESDGERLIDVETHDVKPKLCTRHRARNTASSSSSGPRYKRDSYQEMTTSHSEHERTNSCSSLNSFGSITTSKPRKLSAPPTDSIPWCGCWGAGCV